MHFTSSTTVDSVTARTFAVGDIPGILWEPDGIPTPPLLLLQHGGGQNMTAPGVVGRARRFAASGFASVAIDAPAHGDRPRDPSDESRLAEMQRRMAAGEPLVEFLAESADLDAAVAQEWRVVIDALNTVGVGLGPIGYFGVSYGASVGIPLLATERRIRAAVIGLAGGELLEKLAARITVPVEFDLQWDDELIPRASGLALFDAFGSSEKTLHVNSGGHIDLPRFEVESAARFFERHLG